MRRRRWRAGPWCAWGLALAGCATMGERDCVEGDWTHRGELDGAAGYPVTRFESHREACASHGVEADAVAYRTGHANGLTVFCSPAGGYTAGRDGRGDPELCDGDESFESAWRGGRQVHLERNELIRLEQRVRDIEAAYLRSGSSQERAALRQQLSRAQWQLREQYRVIERLDRRYAERFGAAPLRRFDLP